MIVKGNTLILRSGKEINFSLNKIIGLNIDCFVWLGSNEAFEKFKKTKKWEGIAPCLKSNATILINP